MGGALTSPDVWWCYSVAALLGCVIRGVTGFGAAIAVLSIWALFSVMGLDVGSLEQIVALDAFVGIFATIPMNFLVDVKGKTSWLILGSFLPTQARPASPISEHFLVVYRCPPRHFPATFHQVDVKRAKLPGSDLTNVCSDRLTPGVRCTPHHRDPRRQLERYSICHRP